MRNRSIRTKRFIILLVVLLLVGCGGHEGPDTAHEATPTAAPKFTATRIVEVAPSASLNIVPTPSPVPTFASRAGGILEAPDPSHLISTPGRMPALGEGAGRMAEAPDSAHPISTPDRMALREGTGGMVEVAPPPHLIPAPGQMPLAPAGSSLGGAALGEGAGRIVEVAPPPPENVDPISGPMPALAFESAAMPRVPTVSAISQDQGASAISPKSGFALWEEPAVDVVAASGHEPIAPDLSNVQGVFDLSPAQVRRLARNGFVVTSSWQSADEFFFLYKGASTAGEPLFVSSDSLLHVYHLLFDKTLRDAETEFFIPLLRELNGALLASADEQYQALKDGPWEEAARRTVAFIAVGTNLLEPDAQVPEYAKELVEAELALISEAAGIHPSPLFAALLEDYSQYIPRGHYTRSEALERYFRSMMWYGRMTFRLKTTQPEVGRAETRSALLLVQALRTTEVNGRPALALWADLYHPTVFFVGRSDDLTVLQYADLMDEVYGAQATVNELLSEEKLSTFIAKADQLPPPRILGMVIGLEELDDVEEATKGLRLMGQRFVPDAYIFGQLIYNKVGTPQKPRKLPKGLDITAALGSERAETLLDKLGETSYQNYPAQMAKMQEWISQLSVAEWTETLYNGWLYSLQPLLEKSADGYPHFMQSEAWTDKQLNTVLGSWTELKHDTILYAKQPYGGPAGGPPTPPEQPPRGYVEPVPHFYARLAALTAMTRQGLGTRGLLSETNQAHLARLEGLVRAFGSMAEKELRGEPLNEQEYKLIQFYGKELERLTIAADPDASATTTTYGPPEAPEAAVVADVATDPNGGMVLEEAVGRINPIYVIVPIVAEDGTTYLQLTTGGVFSYYEFPWPLSDRLTDETWRQMLSSGKVPPPPVWSKSFLIAE